ncbi:hypothetical protein A6A06_12535 [Streptomyces sp. CB02923]|uniref:KAP family P-loop NTPase fold protein n=1 Tax=Streptomyces sp. CB02923 TaxID=1718985 RepID=UPI00093D6D99|nr:P-loop NTPase fold protein [Streptomyces sp. CB02923]OKI01945.1 hypothetical protein A6A06_12535 [Streptomyces sp. CB02923]
MLLTDIAIAGVEEDHFGFTPHAEVLCEAIRTTEHLPLTIGIFGPWGMGKSSFMNICRDLLVRRGVPAISFNPWKYDQKDEIWHALIQTVLTEISVRLAERRASGEERQKARLAQAASTAKRLSQAAAWLLARRAAGPLTAGVLTPEDVDRVQTALTEPDVGTYLHINRFEEDFKEVVRGYTDGGRLVLFVDDLDRCSQDAAITVLDSLKLFLGEASCVFVLAMDQQVIAEAAARKLRSDSPDPVRGRQYLEKLIHFPYRLPVVPFEKLYGHLRDKVSAPELSDSRELWEMIQVAFGSNPRRVRRFINGLNLTALTLARHHPPSRERLLHAGSLLVLQMKHPDFFATLETDPGVWARFDEAEFKKVELMGGDALVERANPGVRRFLSAVASRREAFTFPPPPTPNEIRVLTEILAITGGVSPETEAPS